MPMFAIPHGTTGKAQFSVDLSRRLWLERCWGDETGDYALWIGMNPSIAGATVDDPTVIRECNFTRSLGVPRYLKVNVFDHISTDPKGLTALGVVPCSAENFDLVIELAAMARYVILCYGALPKALQPFANRIVKALRERETPLLCLGTTAMGHPRHPLYLRSDTPFLPYVAQTYP